MPTIKCSAVPLSIPKAHPLSNNDQPGMQPFDQKKEAGKKKKQVSSPKFQSVVAD